MATTLSIIQIILSLLIISAILLQAQGVGFGSVWGGGGETYHTRRGAEKIVFVFTIVALVAFAALSVSRLILKV